MDEDQVAAPQIFTQALRRAQQSGALRDASEQGGQLDILAAVAQMANNRGLAAATQTAAQGQRARFLPKALGNTGFMLPQSGDFVESPMFVDEKNAAREAKESVLQQTLTARADAARQERERREQHDKEMLEYRRQHDQDQGALRMTIAGLAASNRGAGAGAKADAAAEKAATKASDNVNKNVSKFGVLLDKNGIPEFEDALGMVEGTLKKYGTGKLPGFGRLDSLLPSALLDTETQMVRTDMQRAANILLASRSGKAVTESEQRRFLTEVGQGKGMSEEALRKGWANVRKGLEARKDNLLSTVDDDTLDEYNSRTPTPLVRRKSITPPPAPAATPGKPVRLRFDAQGNLLQ